MALAGAVAWVVSADPVSNAKRAIQARLQQHGARVVQRLSKDVSHVVFERRRVQASSKRAETDSDVVELYNRLDKVRQPPSPCRERARGASPVLPHAFPGFFSQGMPCIREGRGHSSR